MRDLYNPKEVSQITGASLPAIRNYTTRYARYFSAEATPEAGMPRQFTAADVKLVAFIMYCTKHRSMTHELTEQALNSGELDKFNWQIPEQLPPLQTEEDEEGAPTSTVLVSQSQLQAMQMLFQDYQRREDAAKTEAKEAREREQALAEQLRQLERQLGESQGELKAYKARYRRPKWVQWLFGGE